MRTEKILEQRAETHGSYNKTSDITQEFWNTIDKELIYYYDSEYVIGLKMIAFKLARAISNPFNLDNYDDICGYAQLVRKSIEKDKRAFETKVEYIYPNEEKINEEELEKYIH